MFLQQMFPRLRGPLAWELKVHPGADVQKWMLLDDPDTQTPVKSDAVVKGAFACKKCNH